MNIKILLSIVLKTYFCIIRFSASLIFLHQHYSYSHPSAKHNLSEIRLFQYSQLFTMDGHVEEASSSRDRPSESEERLRKKTKQPRDRNYGVSLTLLLFSYCDSCNFLYH